MKIISVNPYTEEVNKEFDAFTAERCIEAVGKAREALGNWRRLEVEERSRYFRGIGDDLRKNQRSYAETITREMGKPITQSLAEVAKCALLCDYYADNAPRLLQDEIIATEASRSYVTHEPLGVILAIMPWNFPFWQVFRCVVPALIAGNVCLLKHASNVPMCAVALERIFAASDLPSHLFQTLLVGAAGTMDLIAGGGVDGISLTGSCEAGSQVGALAGKMVLKQVLELGGSDPFIILDDADLAGAAACAITARFQNGGQSCIAAKRLIVMKAVAESFLEEFMSRFNRLKVGDPMEEDTDIGPLASKESVVELRKMLLDAIKDGAKVFHGPKPPESRPYFFEPAVVTEVTPAMSVVTEEVFGPVAPILVAEDEDELIQLANATEYGLGAAIWSTDIERAVKLSREIRAGAIAVNDMVKSDPRLPFGGIKKSGVGRELSYHGLKEFSNIKTVVVR